jgi:hypothetical protein
MWRCELCWRVLLLAVNLNGHGRNTVTRTKTMAILIAIAAWSCGRPRATVDQQSNLGLRAEQGGQVPNDAPQTPLHIQWILQSDEGGALQITARIDRLAPLRFPLNVSVRIPDGMALVRGPRAFTVSASDSTGTTDTAYRFRYGKVPADDLVLVADVQNQSFGIHAEDHYRFDRPPPVQARPVASGPHLRIGSNDFGPSILISSQAPLSTPPGPARTPSQLSPAPGSQAPLTPR